jgi:hypothetical protein
VVQEDGANAVLEESSSSHVWSKMGLGVFIIANYQESRPHSINRKVQQNWPHVQA